MTRNRKTKSSEAAETTRERAGAPSRTPKVGLLLAGIAIAGAGIAIFSRSGSRNEMGMPASGAARGFNVLLVTFDTTRPDHLGCYGAGFAKTPPSTRLSKNGVRFANAAVTVPLTLPSHTSILTGKYPYHHGVRTNTGYDVQPSETTLAECLKSAGYKTAAFVSCFVLDARFGLNQGFDVYDFESSEKGNRGPESVFSQREASLTSVRATAWLKDHFKASSGMPFFLWVHYYDPHHPFDSPLTNQPEFAGRPYDAEIAYADSQLANVIGEISNAGGPTER
ncbi:MAG: sulfatase [Planctomycetes bacterium]|nr:sulfatase [Planctomycetota bacterium]